MDDATQLFCLGDGAARFWRADPLRAFFPSRSPFSVDQHHGKVCSAHHAEDAATLAAAWGIGQIKYQHGLVVWDEGKEDFPAGDSYDLVAKKVWERIDDLWRVHHEHAGTK